MPEGPSQPQASRRCLAPGCTRTASCGCYGQLRLRRPADARQLRPALRLRPLHHRRGGAARRQLRETLSPRLQAGPAGRGPRPAVCVWALAADTRRRPGGCSRRSSRERARVDRQAGPLRAAAAAGARPCDLAGSPADAYRRQLQAQGRWSAPAAGGGAAAATLAEELRGRRAGGDHLDAGPAGAAAALAYELLARAGQRWPAA